MVIKMFVVVFACCMLAIHPVHVYKNVCCGVRMLYLVVTLAIHPVHVYKNVCCGVRMLYLVVTLRSTLYMGIKMFVLVFACCI